MRPSILLLLLWGLNSLRLPSQAQQTPPPPDPPAQGAAPVQPVQKAPDEAEDPVPPQAADAPKADAPKTADENGKRVNRGQDRGQDRNQGVEMRLRAMMSDLDVEDPAKQDAIIAYIKEDEAGKNTVRAARGRLANALTHHADTTRLSSLIAVFKAAIDADKERRSAAQMALDAKVGFSLDPRVEAALWLFGVLGDGQTGPPLPLGRAPGNRGGDTGNRRDNGGGNGGGNGGDKTAKRPEMVCGTVAARGAGWIEVRDERGQVERYFTFWTATNGNQGQGYDRALVETIRTLTPDAPVRLFWVWNERKRVVKIEPWDQIAPQPQAQPENQPGNPPDAGPPAKPDAAPVPQTAAAPTVKADSKPADTEN